MIEFLDVVNEKDEVIGKAEYKECHEKGLMHRTSCVFIFKDDTFDEILLTKRNPKVDAPGKFCTVGGHLKSGEDYIDAAKKELQEEIFFKHVLPRNSEIREIRKIFYNDFPNNFEFDAIHIVVFPGPFFPNPNEIEGAISFHPIEKISREVKSNPEKFTVAFLKQFDELLQYLGR